MKFHTLPFNFTHTSYYSTLLFSHLQIAALELCGFYSSCLLAKREHERNYGGRCANHANTEVLPALISVFFSETYSANLSPPFLRNRENW